MSSLPKTPWSKEYFSQSIALARQIIWLIEDECSIGLGEFLVPCPCCKESMQAPAIEMRIPCGDIYWMCQNGSDWALKRQKPNSEPVDAVWGERNTLITHVAIVLARRKINARMKESEPEYPNVDPGDKG